MTGMSTHALVVISPATTTMPVFASDSHATLAFGSCARIPSRIASEMASQTLSGWPSVTDSDVNRYRDIRAPRSISLGSPQYELGDAPFRLNSPQKPASAGRTTKSGEDLRM